MEWAVTRASVVPATEYLISDALEHSDRAWFGPAFSIATGTMTPQQYIDFMVLYEFAHGSGMMRPTDEPTYNRNIWKECFQ